ncbi:MAG TPA: NAD(P)/FAD-dependent oxidoreductase [Candidatus Binatia bacterium]
MQVASADAVRNPGRPERFEVVIVGSGFSGIAMGILLEKAGIDAYVILEKASDVGGTWRDNTYPGAACDIPSHLYSFSFEPKPDWSRAFPPQQEIHDYLRACVDKHGLRSHIRFRSEVKGATFDEREGTWTVRVADGSTVVGRALVLGNGALHIPAYPEIEGLESFEGTTFHSARWNHDYDLRGKRVAVIGTGASAIQFVPEIAPLVGSMKVFQRTPPWILPKPDRPMTEREKWIFRYVPGARWLYRAYTYWMHELRAIGFVIDPRLMKQAEKLAKRYLAKTVRDPELRAKLTPNYTMGCKRILMSNDYYQTLQRDNVKLVTDAIRRVTPKGIETADGVMHEVDAIIFGTGFTATDYLAPLDIQGLDGKLLNDVIRERPETYLGITIHGFPNLYLMMGPNTGLGHNSMVFMIEAQARWALQAIQKLRRDDLAYMDVDPKVQRAFNERIQAKLAHSVWNSGCQSWYLKDGYNATIWPGFTWQYWLETRWLRPAEFRCVKREDASAMGAGALVGAAA